MQITLMNIADTPKLDGAEYTVGNFSHTVLKGDTVYVTLCISKVLRKSLQLGMVLSALYRINTLPCKHAAFVNRHDLFEEGESRNEPITITELIDWLKVNFSVECDMVRFPVTRDLLITKAGQNVNQKL